MGDKMQRKYSPIHVATGLIVIVGYLLALSFAPAANSGEINEVSKAKLASIASDAIVVESIVTSPGGGHIAFYQKSPLGVVVVRDGKELGPYEAVGPLSFSPDGQHLAYAVKKAGIACVVMDGREGKPFEDPSSLVWSPKSDRISFVGFLGEKCMIVTQDAQGCQGGPEFTGMVAGSLRFSPDGRRLCYAAIRNSRQVVVVDGNAGPEYGMISEEMPVFSPDSRRVAYIAGAAAASRRGVLVLDGKVRTESEIVSGRSFHFSPDGERWSFVAERGAKRIAVIQDDAGRRTEGKPYDRIAIVGFTPGGRDLACAVMDNDKSFVVIGGKEQTPHDGILANLVLSPDGKHFAYWLQEGRRWFVVLDGRPLQAYESILPGTPVFSPDGTALAFGAKSHDGWRIVVHRNGKATEFKAHRQTGRPAFSHDGRHVAYTFMDTSTGGVAIDDAVWGQAVPLDLDVRFDLQGRIQFVAFDGTNANSVQIAAPAR